MAHSSPCRLMAIVFSIVSFLEISQLQAQAIRQDWKRKMPTVAPANQFSTRVGTDSYGNAYWAVNHEDSASGFRYIWIEKRDTFANLQFAVFYAGAGGATFTDLKTDLDGNTYLYGVNYGGGNAGTNTSFLNKYNVVGTIQWSVNFDFDENVEVPDQIYISPVNGDIVVTASELDAQTKLLLGRFNSDGNLLWETGFFDYEPGDILVDDNDNIHLTTTYHVVPGLEGDAFTYLMLDGSGNILNSFSQAGGHYSYPLETAGKGRTVGIDEAGNFYCLGWVATFPGQATTWTNIMLYKFDVAGNETWSKRLDRVRKGYPLKTSILLTDYATGELSVVGGNGLWRYGTDGTFYGGWYDSHRAFFDAAMFDREKTFALCAGDPVDPDDSGKICHFDWSEVNAPYYAHGRADIQNLNPTAIIEQDSQHVAMYVTWSYNGKSELHRLVLRDTVSVGIDNSIGLDDEFSVFPNPASDFVTIVFNGDLSLHVTLQLLDVTGKTIMEKSLENERTIQLPVNNLSAGMYQVMITSGNNRYMKKIVVR